MSLRLPARHVPAPGPRWAFARVAVAIRQARPEDMPALSEFFAGLSVHTRYLRFFTPLRPGAALLRTLCGGASHIDALVAVRGGVIVGHAMAVDRAGSRGIRVADVGVVVDDAWQGRGVGSALMRALVTGAQARGVTWLEMEVLDGNGRVLAMIADHWPAARIDHTPDGLAIGIRLPRAGTHPPAIAPRLAAG